MPVNIYNVDGINLLESDNYLEIDGLGLGYLKSNFILPNLLYKPKRVIIKNIIVKSGNVFNWFPSYVSELVLINCGLKDLDVRIPESIRHLICDNCVIRDYNYLVSDKLQNLELINQGLNTLPKCIYKSATNLLFLNLSHNNLRECFIWSSKLRVLNLSYNSIFDMALMGNLPLYLEELDISHNELTDFPIGLPKYLRILNLSHNDLNSLPVCHNQDYPPKLRELNLSNNAMLGLHNDFINISFPEMLQKLNLANCNIKNLPYDWGCNNLIDLDVSYNKIQELDDFMINIININYIGNPCYIDIIITPYNDNNGVILEEEIPSDVIPNNNIILDNVINNDIQNQNKKMQNEKTQNDILTKINKIELEPDIFYKVNDLFNNTNNNTNNDTNNDIDINILTININATETYYKSTYMPNELFDYEINNIYSYFWL